MAESKSPSPFGISPLSLDSELLPGRTPGTLGRLDGADPDRPTLLGDTPGTVGLADRADPDPQGFHPPPPLTLRFGAGPAEKPYCIREYHLLPPLMYEESAEFKAFEQDVLAAHVKRSSRRKAPLAGIEEGKLEEVEKGHQLRKEAAKKCRELLKAARADLASEREALLKKPKADQDREQKEAHARGEVLVTQVVSIGITSGYRSFEHDSALWHRYFRKKYYPTLYPSLSRLNWWEGGLHGRKAVSDTVAFVGKRKAAPGFSNHTNGIAVDFFTVEGGKTLQAETGHGNKDLKRLNARWEKSWLYRWLDKHRKEYGVHRILTEAWHWEFGE